MVETWHDVGRRLARYAAIRRQRQSVICARSLLWWVHDEHAGRGSQEQEGVDRVPLQRRRSGGRTRRSCTAARPAPVFLEECQLGARHHAAGSGRGWVLGAQRLSQLRRPMAGATVLGRLKWHVCTVVGLRDETATARTIALQVPDWPGHVAGQRVDLRVTASDGYSAVREYSIASEPRADGRIELTVERLPDGEVSPYLTQGLVVGDHV